jgi:antibiotic biosynthesis monooxygenase (ABM) superfamily enzyme
LVVLVVIKWDIHPDKHEAYVKWRDGAIKRMLAVPGVVEFRGYRGLVGAPDHLVTYEFADLAAYAAWRGNEGIRKVLDELHTIALNVTSELWGPSTAVPKPIRPST